MYNRAKQAMGYQPVPTDFVSVRAFMQAVNEMNHLE